MAKLKVSELQRATSVNLTDLVYVVQSSTSKAVTVQNLLGLINGNVTVTGRITTNALVANTVSIVTINGLVKGNGANALTAAVVGTDYQAPLPTQSGQAGKYLTTDGSALSWATVSGPVSRATVSGTTASLANAATANLSITGYKGYLLYKIQTSTNAWVRIYTDTASRTADAARDELTDPAPSAGIIAEVITTGPQTILISPGAVGFSNEASPTTNIPIAVTNKSGNTAAITVTLTVLQLEA